MTLYMGMDVHTKTTTYVIQDENEVEIAKARIRTTPQEILGALEESELPAGTVIGLETGTQAFWLAGLLAGAGMKPQVIDAAEVRAKSSRPLQKDDFRDARDICAGVRRRIYDRVVWMPPVEVRRLREIISRRRHFVRAATREVNAAKGVLRTHGLRQGECKLASEQAWNRMVTNVPEPFVAELLKMHLDLWLTTQRLIAKLDAELDEELEPFRDEIALLTTVPGVGRVVAATFVATIGTPDRFPTSSHVASYAGLTPMMWDSGERERHGRITRQGSGELRAMLCEAAHHAAKPKHPLNPYFRRICAKSGLKKAIVSVAHRLARILWRMWRNNEAFDFRKLNVEFSPRTTERTVCWHIRATA